MAPSSIDALVLISCLGCALWLRSRARRPNLPHPPGPPGLPLLGNLLDVPSPSAFPWETYRGWSDKYGSDIVRLTALGMNIVVTNTLEVTNELLDKRSSTYSDRPRMVMLGELCGFDWGLAFIHYGTPWKDSRKMAHHDFNASAVKKYRPQIAKSTNRLLLNIIQEPDRLTDNLRQLAAMAIMSIAYDINVESLENQYIQIAEAVAECITRTTNAGSYVVDVLPFLKYLPEWFPGAGFPKEARIWREDVMRLLNDPYEDAHKRLAAGNLGDCAMKSFAEHFGKDPRDPAYTDFIMRSTLGSLYIGGADTTVAALGSFFLAMVLNPGVQQKAQEELDHVVGSHRLPDFSDKPLLPYIEAIVRESIRWNPIVPLDVPHMLTEDDIYEGYYLPKGSLVVANIWAILHDENQYPDHSVFNPDRFLCGDGTLNHDVRDPSVAAFGFGRRICPGRFMSLDSIWLAIARLLTVFEIGKKLGEDGKEITPDGDYHRGFLCHPKPFPLTIKPRSAEHAALLEAIEPDQA
ncbi:cytochrome P450 [Epithele typhae]|uniref:cytochrome P450 n=1 Tax=Epithele typhae TaxID=378194 RepID=UPI002007ED05|nr:cytochrome P450 [Epithele typhae]KAH9946329.1 cytochrome P450 [Epithele typhae]